MNDTDWAAIEDSESSEPYAPRRRPMPHHKPMDANDHLMGAPEPEPEEDGDPPWITAKYDGRCSACDGFHIIAGETRIRADGFDGWEAEECAW